MKYLLDTNTLSDFYSKEDESYLTLNEKLQYLTDEDEIYISALSLFELEYGYENAPENMQNKIRGKINDIKNDFYVLPLDINASSCFGKLKKALVATRKLNKKNSKKHNIDVMLASIAISESFVLVSSDKIYAELQRLNNELQTQNWLK